MSIKKIQENHNQIFTEFDLSDSKSETKVHNSVMPIFDSPPRTPVIRKRTIKAEQKKQKKVRNNNYKSYDNNYKPSDCTMIKINETSYDLKYISSGSYMDVFLIKYKNSECVLKKFKQKQPDLKFKQKQPCLKQNSFIKNYAKNYNEVKNLGLPVAKIINIDTMVEDNYIIQEFVKDDIDISNGAKQLQIREFFDCSVQKKILIDCLPENFRQDANGKVLLIDFVGGEGKEATEETFNPLYINKGLLEWGHAFAKKGHNKEETKIFLEMLTEKIYAQTETYTSIEDILGDVFFEVNIPVFQINKN